SSTSSLYASDPSPTDRPDPSPTDGHARRPAAPARGRPGPGRRGSDLEVGDHDYGLQGRHPVQEAYALDFVGVLAQLGAGGVAGDRLADLGVDGDDDQGAVQGVDLR